MNRGDRREEIFRDDVDRTRFLEALEAVCQKTGWQVHAYCLMSNHFHLVVETPRANLVEGMKWLLGTYTMRFNRRHKLSGHLFAGSLQVTIDRRSDARLFAHGVRLCAFESRAGQVGWKAGAIAKVSLE
jgi:REP element-mobilizing transposase RayT